MGKLLTVSVAAYNVEKYLEQTLQSLNDERVLDSIEVLIVDDGSKDGTRDIAQRYQAIAPETFHYVAKENGGHGSTINKGIELARGKYFRVLDGDDWVDTEGFVKYLDALKSSDADIVLAQVVSNNGTEEKLYADVPGMESGRIYSWEDEFDVYQMTIHMVTVKTDLLREAHIHITEKCYYVDIEYTIWACYLSRSIQFIKIPVYIYRVGSISQSTNKKNMLKNIDMQKTVAFNVVRMYEQFRTTDNFIGVKREVIFRRVAQSVGATIRTFFLMDNAKEIKECIVAFEKEIKALSGDLYEKMNTKRFFRLLRWHEYLLLPTMCTAYRVWVAVH